MPPRNVVLTDQQSAMLDRLVQSGRYQNASEVLRDGLRLVQQRDAEDAARLTALREAASAGIADFDAGRYSSFTSGEALRDHLAARADEILYSQATLGIIASARRFPKTSWPGRALP